ncbi:hypothetical protein D9M68_450990 [compost metagenome]
MHQQGDFPLFGELDGIADQVDQHLLQALGIADEGQRHAGLDPDHQLQVLVRGIHRHHRGQGTEHIVQAERRWGDRQMPGLQLGEIQYVVEDHQQGFARAPEHLQVLALVGGEGGARQQLGDAQHGVHRRADLVAHAGDEFAFRPAGNFRAFHGVAQLLCRFLLPADVLGNAEKADDLLGRVAHGGDGELHREPRAILAHVGPFARFGTTLAGYGDQHLEAAYRGIQRLAQLGGASVHFLANMQHGKRLPIDQVGVAIAEHPLRAGVEYLDGAVDIGSDDRELAGRIDQGAEADFGFGEGDGQLLGERLGVFAQGGQVPHHEEQQQADERAADQHDDRFLAVYRRFEGGQRRGLEGPLMLGQRDRRLLGEGIGVFSLLPGRQGAAGIHQGGFVDGVAIVDLQGYFGAAVAERAGHEIVDPECAVDEALQGHPAFGGRRRRQSAAVDRQVQQGTVLHVVVGFLYQPDLAREGGPAGLPGVGHRDAPHRLGEHVEPEGAQVAPGERFEIRDRGVFRALAGGPDPEVRETFTAYAVLEGGLVPGGEVIGIADALDAPIGLRDFLGLHELPPLLAPHRVGCAEQPLAAAQHLFIGFQALADPLLDVVHLEGEPLLGLGLGA